ncbi:MAG: hypothetical protein GY720_09480 [bacterium]|nr:hypothetical protein [bacterium]
MRRAFVTLVVIALLLAVIVVASGELPEGNPFREATGFIRRLARRFADSFGGGYTAT